MSICKKILWMTLFILLCPRSFAAREYFLEVIKPNCSLGRFSKAAKKFKKSNRPLSWFQKKNMVGRNLETAKNVVVFRMLEDEDKELFAASITCFRRGAIYDESAPDVTAIKIGDLDDIRIEHMNENRAPRRPGYYFLSLMSWQESVNLIQNASGALDREELPVAISALVLCPGFGKMVLKTDSLLFAWDTCLPFGIAEIGLKSTDTSSPTFQASGNRIYGIITGPVLTTAVSERFGVGLSVPFTYRQVHMPPSAGSGYSSPSKSSFFPSFLLDAQYKKDNWIYGYRVGMLKTWPNYIWSFQVSKAF